MTDGASRWLLYAGAALGMSFLLRMIAASRLSHGARRTVEIRLAAGLSPRARKVHDDDPKAGAKKQSDEQGD